MPRLMDSMRILIISPVGTHPQHQGNWERVYQIANCLRELGHTIYLLHLRTGAFDGTPANEAAREFFEGRLQVVDTVHWFSRKIPGISLRAAILRKLRLAARQRSGFASRMIERHLEVIRGLDAWAPTHIGPILKEVRSSFSPEVVIVEYAIFSKFLGYFPKSTLKLIDTHDRFTDRDSTCRDLGSSGWISLTRKQETRALLRANHIIAIQRNEASYFSELCGNRRRIFCVEQLAEVVELAPPSQADPCIGYIGSGNPLNVAGLRWFLDEIWPVIQRKIPSSLLLLAGDICQHFDGASGVVKLGRVESRDGFYERCRLVINPVRKGTGLKIKSVEALRYGRPLVSTHEGVTGLEFTGQEGFVVSDSAGVFAAACAELLGDPGMADKMSRLATEFSRSIRLKSVMSLREALTPLN